MKNNLVNKIKTLDKFTLSLIVVVIVLIVGGFFAFQKFTASKTPIPLQEVDLPFDPEGPYALLIPRRDGHALNLNITRVSSYDAISYELAYQSKATDIKNFNGDGEATDQGIQRGVQGTLNTKDKKNEYSQEILFGTCSQGFTSGGAHCSFDNGVENGTLTLRIQKGTVVYKSVISWHLQQPDIALGVISSGDNHFMYKTTASREDLANIGWSIVNDLSGAPKLPEGKAVLGKVYAFNVPTAKSFPKGTVTVELGENPPSDAKLARYNDAKNTWDLLETKINGSTLTSPADNNGIFAVLVNKAK